jgi:hypothetical protein
MLDPAAEEFSHHLAQARAGDRAAIAHRAREARRHAGASWSGVSAEPMEPRSEPELQAVARARLAAARAWRDRSDGAFLAAIASVQRAAESLHAGAEQARAGAARGLSEERARCAALVGDLRRQVREIAAGLRAAGAALDRMG